MKKKSWIAVLVLVVLVAAAAVCWFAFGPKGQAGEKYITVLITHSDNTVNTYELHTEAEFLRQAMEEAELLEGVEAEYGLFITAVDGETADGTDNRWWVYTKGGEYVEYGVEQCAIANGDQYEFYIETF